MPATHTCEVCEKVFTQKDSLNRHMLIHNGEKTYSCNICGKSFARKANFMQHMRIHTGEKPFSCNACGKSFRFSSNLASHQLIHSDVRPYSCEICGRAFKLKGNLTHHKLTHTGEKPFTCPNCGKGFTRANDVKRHMNRKRTCTNVSVQTEPRQGAVETVTSITHSFSQDSATTSASYLSSPLGNAVVVTQSDGVIVATYVTQSGETTSHSESTHEAVEALLQLGSTEEEAAETLLQLRGG